MNLNLPIYKLTSRLDKTEAIHIFTLVAIWIFMILLVNPSGNFPLMDDWDYGRAVQSIVEKGKFYFSSWPAMNLVAQIFWGALFCLPFGFSFNALRFSTLILGLTGVLGTYGLLREINLHSTIALLGALVVAVNPVYFGLSNTFMSDVPFFAFAILSLLFLIRGLQKESVNEIVIGTITACIALLIRQLAIAIVLAFGCAYIFKKGKTLSRDFLQQ